MWLAVNRHCAGTASTVLPKLYLGDPLRYNEDGFDKFNNILGKTLNINKIIEIENILNINNVKYIKRFRWDVYQRLYVSYSIIDL